MSGVPAPATLDQSVWRAVGDPLVPGRAAGPLAGRTVAVKDVFAVRGHPVGAGNPTWLADQPPAEAHAEAVSVLLEAGAAVAGIARTDELAYSIAGTNSHYGTPPNPAAPDRVCGGSSSGPAAAVALGQADIGLGTDTAGSVRVPASYLGLYGLRGTHGAQDRTGMLALAPSFDTVGWLARDASTLADTVQVALPDARRAPLTRAVLVPSVCAVAEEPVRDAFRAVTGRLVRDGVLPEPDRADIAPDDLSRWTTAFRTVQGHEAWAQHGGWVTAHPGALGPDVAGRFAVAARISAGEASAARAVLADAREQLLGLLAPGTALLLPATSTPAPARSAPGGRELEQARASTLRLTCLAAIAGAPALTLPLARVGGAPVGLSLLAAPGADQDLTDLAPHFDPNQHGTT